MRGQSWNIILKQSSYWPFAHLDHLEQSCWPAICGCHIRTEKLWQLVFLLPQGHPYVLTVRTLMFLHKSKFYLFYACGAFLDTSSPGTLLKTRMENKIYEQEGPPRNNLVQRCCCPPSFQAVTKASFIVPDPQGPFEIQHSPLGTQSGPKESFQDPTSEKSCGELQNHQRVI